MRERRRTFPNLPLERNSKGLPRGPNRFCAGVTAIDKILHVCGSESRLNSVAISLHVFLMMTDAGVSYQAGTRLIGRVVTHRLVSMWCVVLCHALLNLLLELNVYGCMYLFIKPKSLLCGHLIVHFALQIPTSSGLSRWTPALRSSGPGRQWL